MVLLVGSVSAADFYNYVYNGSSWIPMLSTEDGQQKLWVELKNCSYGTVQNDLDVWGDLNVTGFSYLSGVTIAADNITTNEIISKDGNISFMNNSQNVNFFIKEDGKVGIGTVSPGFDNAAMRIKDKTKKEDETKKENEILLYFANIMLSNDNKKLSEENGNKTQIDWIVRRK